MEYNLIHQALRSGTRHKTRLTRNQRWTMKNQSQLRRGCLTWLSIQSIRWTLTDIWDLRLSTLRKVLFWRHQMSWERRVRRARLVWQFQTEKRGRRFKMKAVTAIKRIKFKCLQYSSLFRIWTYAASLRILVRNPQSSQIKMRYLICSNNMGKCRLRRYWSCKHLGGRMKTDPSKSSLRIWFKKRSGRRRTQCSEKK